MDKSRVHKTYDGESSAVEIYLHVWRWMLLMEGALDLSVQMLQQRDRVIERLAAQDVDAVIREAVHHRTLKTCITSRVSATPMINDIIKCAVCKRADEMAQVSGVLVGQIEVMCMQK